MRQEVHASLVDAVVHTVPRTPIDARLRGRRTPGWDDVVVETASDLFHTPALVDGAVSVVFDPLRKHHAARFQSKSPLSQPHN
jgi:hypothetical protein